MTVRNTSPIEKIRNDHNFAIQIFHGFFIEGHRITIQKKHQKIIFMSKISMLKRFFFLDKYHYYFFTKHSKDDDVFNNTEKTVETTEKKLLEKFLQIFLKTQNSRLKLKGAKSKYCINDGRRPF